MRKDQEMYRLPEGYFGDLRDRLSSIPETAGGSGVSAWGKVAPHLALVASFACVALVGGLILQSTKGTVPPKSERDDYVVYVSSQHPYSIYGADVGDVVTVSSEDVVNYLIEEGVQSEKLAYLASNE